MKNDDKLPLKERIQKRLTLFFSDITYSEAMIEEQLDSGDIFFKPADILPFLQTALLDEKIVEVELNGITQVYFNRIYDDLPDLVGEQDMDESELQEPVYSPGDYLKDMTHLITLPLEPGMGNFNIRYTNKILLRFYTAAYAVEIGTFFQDLTKVRGLPVIRFDYPIIGRIVRGAREYRAKVPDKMDIKIMVMGKRKQKTITTKLLNVSSSGFAFLIKKNQQDQFIMDETRSMEIIINDMLMLGIKGKICHISKIRGKKGTEYHCGVKADLVTRAVAAKLEEIVATVQRAHLRSISELSMDSGINILT